MKRLLFFIFVLIFSFTVHAEYINNIDGVAWFEGKKVTALIVNANSYEVECKVGLGSKMYGEFEYYNSESIHIPAKTVKKISFNIKNNFFNLILIEREDIIHYRYISNMPKNPVLFAGDYCVTSGQISNLKIIPNSDNKLNLDIQETYITDYKEIEGEINNVDIRKCEMALKKSQNSWDISYKSVPEIIIEYRAPRVDSFNILHFNIRLKEKGINYESTGGINTPDILIINEEFNIENNEKSLSSDVVVEWTGYNTRIFSSFEGDPPNPHAKLYLYFKNNHTKTLKGLIFNIKLLDNFGSELAEADQKFQITVNPNTEGKCSFNFFEHMDYNIYSTIVNESLDVKVKILKVVFEDGTILNVN